MSKSLKGSVWLKVAEVPAFPVRMGFKIKNVLFFEV